MGSQRVARALSLKPLHEIPLETRRVIAGLEFTDSKDGDKVKKIKLADRRTSLNMLMRYHSLYRDKVEVSGGAAAHKLIGGSKDLSEVVII